MTWRLWETEKERRERVAQQRINLIAQSDRALLGIDDVLTDEGTQPSMRAGRQHSGNRWPSGSRFPHH